jgi:hypothetical protein
VKRDGELMPRRLLAAAAALLLVACKGPEEWLADLNTVHDDGGKLRLETYDAGQLSFEAMSGLAEEETLTLSQAARAIAAAARVVEGVEQPLLRSQAVTLIGRLSVRYPIPPRTAPFVVADPMKAADAAFEQIKLLDRFDQVFEIELAQLPLLKSPDRSVVEGALARLRESTGADAGRTFEAWDAWWKANRDRLRSEAAAGSAEPLRVLAGLNYGDPERTTGLKTSRAVLRYLGFRAALYEFPELRALTEEAILSTARQTAVFAIAYSLRADDAVLRTEAARAAARVADPAFAAALVYALRRERDTAARVAILRAMASFPGKAAVVEALVEQVPDEDEAFKAAGDDDRSLGLEARRSLVAVTGEDFGPDAGAWRLWWEKTGKNRWP